MLYHNAHEKKVKLELERNDYVTIVFPSLTHSSL